MFNALLCAQQRPVQQPDRVTACELASVEATVFVSRRLDSLESCTRRGGLDPVSLSAFLGCGSCRNLSNNLLTGFPVDIRSMSYLTVLYGATPCFGGSNPVSSEVLTFVLLLCLLLFRSLSFNDLSSLISFPMLLTLRELYVCAHSHHPLSSIASSYRVSPCLCRYLASSSLTTVPVGLTVLSAIEILYVLFIP